jgi:hypothetical protein
MLEPRKCIAVGGIVSGLLAAILAGPARAEDRIAPGHYPRVSGYEGACDQDILDVQYVDGYLSSVKVKLCGAEPFSLSCVGQSCAAPHGGRFISQIDVTGPNAYTWTRSNKDTDDTIMAGFIRAEEGQVRSASEESGSAGLRE